MILRQAQDDRETFVSRITARAAALAVAAAENRLRARRADTSRWRSARLLWPLFAKDR